METLHDTATRSKWAEEAELLARVLNADPAACMAIAATYGSVRHAPAVDLEAAGLTRGQVDGIAELASYYSTAAPIVPDSLRSTADVFARYSVAMATGSVERFVALLLDTKHRLIAEVVVSVGTLTQALVHPREVLRAALLHSAAAMILMHNHPSGDTTPSPADLLITRRIRECGEMFDIRVLDHVIFGRGSYCSMVEGGHW